MLGKYCVLGGCLAEIIFFLYKTGEAMLDATIRPFVIEAVCRDMTRDLVIMSSHWTPQLSLLTNGSLEPCDRLDLLPSLESAVQKRSASFLIVYRVLVNVPAVFLGLFCGAWSDRTGRKLPMMIPSLGSIGAVLLNMAGLLMPQHTLLMIMLGATCQGVLGKSSVITMAVNSYITDTTQNEERTRKLGKLLAMNFFGLFVGSLLAGALQDIAGLETTFATVAVFHAASVLTVLLCMDESIHDKMPSEQLNGESQAGLFSYRGLKESVHVLLKPREKGGRRVVLALFLAMFLNQTCKVGEQDVTVLFVQRPPLSWPPSGYGYLLSVDYAVMGLCLLLLLPVLSTFLHISDTVIVLIGLLFKLTRSVWAGFCVYTWMVFTSVIIGSLAGIVTSSLRSILSKSVHDDETGKVFALASSGETAAKLIGSISFTSIYSATEDIWPGVAYMCSAMVFLCLIVLMVWLYKEQQLLARFGLAHDFLSPYPEKTSTLPAILEPDSDDDVAKDADMLLPLSASSATLLSFNNQTSSK